MHDRVLRVVAVVGGLGLSVVASVGCDSDQRKADQKVSPVVTEGVHLLSVGETDKALKTLQPAAADKLASVTTQINAQAALGQSELDTANQLLGQIADRRIEIACLVWDISQLGRQIEATNNLIATYKQYEPVEPRQDIEGKISDAQGKGADAAWVEHDNTKIPALSATAQTLSSLQGEIAERQDKIKGLTSERSTAISDSEKAVQESEAAKGQESVDAYIKSAQLRRKAADLATEIDVIKNEVSRLQRQLAVAQGQKKIAESAVAKFKAQDEQLNSDWEKMQEQITAQQEKSRELLEASASATETIAPTTGPSDVTAAAASVGGSIRAKAARLDDVLKQTETLMQSAETQVNSAIGHFEAAAKLSEDVNRELKSRQQNKKPDSPEYVAWQNVIDLYPAAGMRLYEGIARQTLATIHAQRAGILKSRVQLYETLQKILETAELKLPSELEGADLGAQLSTSNATADKLFTEANEQLVTVSEAPQLAKDGRGTAAKIARMLTLYGWATLARELGDTTSADSRINEALSLRNEVMTQPNVVLPALPPELAPPPPAPVVVATPTTEPTTAPATAPAEGAPATGGFGAPVGATVPAEGAPAAPAVPAAPTPGAAPPTPPAMPAPPPPPPG